VGEREQAVAHYRQILAINPRHWESLARIVHAKTVSNGDLGLVDLLRAATKEAKVDDLDREGAFFALGKALDDLGEYDDAFAAYQSANEIGRHRNSPYDRAVAEQGFDRLIEVFSADWLKRNAINSEVQPIFICGMFRSGTTLVERILAGHPQITAGGELDFLPRLVAERLAPFPERARSATGAELAELASEYLSRVRALFPGRQTITDKRPDNFLFLGLIRTIFPDARIVYTKRSALDNCLSIYFQQLGGNLAYATGLEDTAHYYRQHERLMLHWLGCFDENILTVDYDELVNSPKPVVQGLLRFLGLEWNERCLEFQRVNDQVKTASVWQVRDELHALSSGRWRNYAPYVEKIRAILD